MTKRAPYRYPPHVRLVVLERLAAGERLKDICRGDGMPCAESVTGWMRADPGFAAAVAQARLRGDDTRRRFDPVRAEAFLARARAGASIRDLLDQPGMPSQRDYRRWKAQQAPFAEALHAIRQQRTADNAARMRGRFRPYDPEVGERIYVRLWKGETLRALLRSDKAFPSLAVLARWRRENPDFDRMLQVAIGGWRKKRGHARLALTQEIQDRVVEGLLGGASLRSLSREPGMPCQQTLYTWCRTRPEFAAVVAMACEDREDWYLAEAVKAAGRGQRRKVAKLNAQRGRLRKRPGWKTRKGDGSSPPSP